MDTFFRFLYEFLSQFFSGLNSIVMGLVNGIGKILSKFIGFASTAMIVKLKQCEAKNRREKG